MAMAPRIGLSRRTLLRAGLLASLPAASQAAEPSGTPALPAELQDVLPDALALGSAKLRFLGLDIYQARLWTRSGFQAAAYAQHPFALELGYFRSLSGPLIAERSLKEMRRQGSLAPEREKAWLAAMVQAFPDVRAGDRITGLHSPGAATRFWCNGQSRPAVQDGAFGAVFFGIWLSEASSEPQMRDTLLGRAA